MERCCTAAAAKIKPATRASAAGASVGTASYVPAYGRFDVWKGRLLGKPLGTATHHTDPRGLYPVARFDSLNRTAFQNYAEVLNVRPKAPAYRSRLVLYSGR